jgi:hypothetical protein
MARYGPLPRPVPYHLIFILINNLAADDGVQNLGAENLVFRDSQNVLRENGDAGQFARLERAFDIFFKRPSRRDTVLIVEDDVQSHLKYENGNSSDLYSR